MLFDPENFKDQVDLLRVNSYKLNENELRDYARLATTIRHRISTRAAEAQEEQKEADNEQDELEDHVHEQLSHQYNQYDQEIIRDEANPAAPNRKRRSMRVLSAATRLEIVRLASTTKHTYQELAMLYNVKVQMIRNLKKDAKKHQRYFVNKKKNELLQVHSR